MKQENPQKNNNEALDVWETYFPRNQLSSYLNKISICVALKLTEGKQMNSNLLISLFLHNKNKAAALTRSEGTERPGECGSWPEMKIRIISKAA